MKTVEIILAFIIAIAFIFLLIFGKIAEASMLISFVALIISISQHLSNRPDLKVEFKNGQFFNYYTSSYNNDVSAVVILFIAKLLIINKGNKETSIKNFKLKPNFSNSTFQEDIYINFPEINFTANSLTTKTYNFKLFDKHQKIESKKQIESHVVFMQYYGEINKDDFPRKIDGELSIYEIDGKHQKIKVNFLKENFNCNSLTWDNREIHNTLDNHFYSFFPG